MRPILDPFSPKYEAVALRQFARVKNNDLK